MEESKYQIEYNIRKLIQNDNNCSAHFEYESNYTKVKVHLVTYNPAHKTHFLLHTTEAESNLEALKKMYDHVFNLKNTLKEKNSPYFLYSIEWYSRKEGKSQTSSFYGSDIQDILRKFYYKRDFEDLTLLKMSLLPTPSV